jgi:hypothetical protein
MVLFSLKTIGEWAMRSIDFRFNNARLTERSMNFSLRKEDVKVFLYFKPTTLIIGFTLNPKSNQCKVKDLICEICKIKSEHV